jgi:hypothetical protein
MRRAVLFDVTLCGGGCTAFISQLCLVLQLMTGKAADPFYMFPQW